MEASIWENLYGGCVIYMGVDDGHTSADSQERPLELHRIRKVLWLKVIDRRYITAGTELDLDPRSPRFGEPTHYLIVGPRPCKVHRSRLIVFPGAMTTRDVRAARGGWGISVLEPVYEALQRHVSAWQVASNTMSNAQYVVYKLKGLAHMLGMPGGEEKAKERSRAMELAKSMINAVLIDEGDEYLRENPNFGNMPELLEMFMYDVAHALDMPQTELFGRSPAGMNATGESDRKQWHESVEDDREHRIRPRAQELVEVILAAKEGPTKGVEIDDWRVTFKPLEQLSEKEWSEVRLNQAQADKAYVEAEILLPSEVASSRFRPEGWSAETKVDMETRETLRELELQALEESFPTSDPRGAGSARDDGGSVRGGFRS